MGLFGIDAFGVEVEVFVAGANEARFNVVGLPDASVRESADRVRAALRNTGYHLPNRAITVNLAPGDRRKEGPAFELPIALGLLEALDSFQPSVRGRFAVAGELALDGRVRVINGALPMSIACRDAGLDGIILPVENAQEAGVVQGIDVIPVAHLSEAVGFLTGALTIRPVRLDVEEIFRKAGAYQVDFAEVRGQETAKRALEIAAAGAHNVLMIGPPGAGKSMLADRMRTILPALTLEESLETTRIYSVCGQIDPDEPLKAVRPFRSPHHTISNAGLVGGGSNPRPGEISLAHNGMLFLDELPEFTRSALESLRQPLEDGRATIARASMSVTFPCRFMLVAAMNPCRCGYLGHPKRNCRCHPNDVIRYRARISGPLLDRIDIHVDVPPVEYRELSGERTGERSDMIRARVEGARSRQAQRFADDAFFANAHMQARHIEEHCRLDDACRDLMRQAMETIGLSARAYTKVLKVARTIADLDGRDRIEPHHLSEAVGCRTLDRAME